MTPPPPRRRHEIQRESGEHPLPPMAQDDTLEQATREFMIETRGTLQRMREDLSTIKADLHGVGGQPGLVATVQRHEFILRCVLWAGTIAGAALIVACVAFSQSVVRREILAQAQPPGQVTRPNP